jgi:hypothetical protein
MENCTINYSTKATRISFHVNNIQAHQHSKRSNTMHNVISALDEINKTRIANSNIRRKLFEQHTVPGNQTTYYRTIELSKHSRVTLIANIQHLSDYGLTNGCTGTVYSIVPIAGTETSMYVLRERNITVYDRPPVVLFKPDKLDPKLQELQYPGIPPWGLSYISANRDPKSQMWVRIVFGPENTATDHWGLCANMLPVARINISKCDSGPERYCCRSVSVCDALAAQVKGRSRNPATISNGESQPPIST